MHDRGYYSFELDEESFILTLYALAVVQNDFFDREEWPLGGRTNKGGSSTLLMGKEFGTDKRLLMVTNQVRNKNKSYTRDGIKTTLTARVEVYIRFAEGEYLSSTDEVTEVMDVNAISFQATEIDGFFSPVPYHIDRLNRSDGALTLNVNPYEETSNEFSFQYKTHKTIKAFLSTVTNAQYKSKNPLRFKRRLTHSFESTDDWAFLKDLILDTRAVFMYEGSIHVSVLPKEYSF